MLIKFFGKAAVRIVRTAPKIAILAMPYYKSAPTARTNVIFYIFIHSFDVFYMFCMTYHITFIVINKYIVY